jgi:predicted site-specific integrase-resolvase
MNEETRRFITQDILTSQELAEFIGVKLDTVKHWANRGKIDYVLKGPIHLFAKSDFKKGSRDAKPVSLLESRLAKSSKISADRL